jgi:hypothetical protein
MKPYGGKSSSPQTWDRSQYEITRLSMLEVSNDEKACDLLAEIGGSLRARRIAATANIVLPSLATI